MKTKLHSLPILLFAFATANTFAQTPYGVWMKNIRKLLLKRLFITGFLIILTLGLVINAEAADRYWVGGTDNWDGTAGSKWSTTSGGAGGASVPIDSDNVYFDANSGSGTVTVVTVQAETNNLNFTGFTGTLAGSQVILVGQSLTMGSGMTNNHTGTFAFYATSGTQIITSNGIVLGNIQIQGNGGTTQLADNLSCSNLLLLYGTFNANNKNVTCSHFISSNSNTRTLTMGSGTWTLTGETLSNEYVWDLDTTTGLTFNANTSTIKTTNASNNNKTFRGGGLTYCNYEIACPGANVIRGGNTFNDFKVNAGRGAYFEAGTTTTVTTLTAIGTAGNTVYIGGETASNWTISKSSGTVTVDYCFIYYSQATGGATWNATNSTDAGNNTGWNFTTVGILETTNNNSFSVYPNPFSTQTTLQTDKIFRDATLTVYNSYGQQVKQILNISGQTITLHRDKLPSGLYFIRLTQDNKTFTTDKLVITDN
jgi:hypothetical protein